MDPRHLEHGHHPREIAQIARLRPLVEALRDWVYGGIDGTVTTPSPSWRASWVPSLDARVVLILGACNILADGLSMAAANYSSTKTEIDEYEHVRRMEERHVELAPEGEREEVRQIFQAKGFHGEALVSAVEVITERRERWIDTMMTEEHGLPPVTRSPVRSALFTFLAFLICGCVPLIPYALRFPKPLLGSTIMTGLTFFAIGSLRSRWSPTPWWRAGTETFAIGMIAALVAYVVGDVLQGLV